jgi:hypothetical protein
VPNQIHRHRSISLTQPDHVPAVSFGMTADSMNEHERFTVPRLNNPSLVGLATIMGLTTEQIYPD